MKTMRYTKESLRQQLVPAANRIISDSYDIELLAWDAEQKRRSGVAPSIAALLFLAAVGAGVVIDAWRFL